MTTSRPRPEPTGSLRTRLSLRILALALTASVVSALSVFIAAGQIVSGQIRDDLASAVADREQDLDRLVDERLADVIFAASGGELQRDISTLIADPGDSATVVRVRSRLTAMFGADQAFDEVFVDGLPDARVIVSTEPGRAGIFEPLPTYFLEGRRAPFVQEVYSSSQDLRPVLTVAAPVRDPSGATVAVLVGHLNLAHVETLLQEGPEERSRVETYLVSNAGDFVSADRFGREDFRRGPSSRGIDAALAGASDVESYDNYAGEPVLGAYRWLPDRRMALLMEVPASDALVPARRLGLIVLFTGLAGTLVIGLAGVSLARDIARPVEALVAAADQVAAGDFSVAVPPGGGDEIGRLSAAFVSMADRLRRTYHQLENQVAVTTDALGEAESSRQILRAIVDNSTSLIGVCSQDGVFQLTNARLTDVINEGPDLVGTNIRDVVPESVSRLAFTLATQALVTQRPVETEFQVELEGQPNHFFAVVFPLQPGDPESEVGFIALDRTDRVRAEASRLQLESQLQHTQKLESLGLLAGGVAHDFNNLLQAIMGHVSLLEEESECGSAGEHLEAIELAAQRAADLTHQLLAYAGRRSLRSEKVSINQALTEISELVAVTVPKTAVFERDLAPDTGSVQADPAQVGQVLMNLITNAADALVDGRGKVGIRTRRVELGSLRPVGMPSPEDLAAGDYVEITVEDTGSGMDPETMARIFDPFFTTKDAGRGLGLAAVMGIVHGSGGHLSVSSVPGRGSRFTVLFPRISDPEPSTRPARGSAAELSGRRILVADDEDAVRDFIAQVLARAGAEVDEHENGESALRAFEAAPDGYDAAVLDLTMPQMGGADALLAMRSLRGQLPAILSSGYDVDDTVGPLLQMDGIEFLQKPYPGRQLVETLATLLSRTTG